MPSRMALILGIPSADLEKVIYFAGYIVTKVNEETKKRLLSELETEYKSKYKELQKAADQEALKERMTLAQAGDRLRRRRPASSTR